MRHHPPRTPDSIARVSGPRDISRQKMQAGHVFSSVQPPKDFRREGGVDRRGGVPICPHERLSRSSATALPMASGSSVYPLGT
jgi:hypothetical protein